MQIFPCTGQGCIACTDTARLQSGNTPSVQIAKDNLPDLLFLLMNEEMPALHFVPGKAAHCL